MQRIYLDHAATTPLDPAVLEAMLPYFQSEHGNASSLHREGSRARSAVEQAREQIAALLGARPEELHFTSGGTESDNAAIFGVAWARPGRRVIASRIEHHAVLHACEELGRQGREIMLLPVDEEGRVDLAALDEALDGDTALVSLMAANNEVGTLQPIEQAGALCRERGVPLHCDAVQAAAYLPLDLAALPVDLLSLSGHKLYGPKGVGLLYLREGIPLRPLLWGGGHEFGRRAGTENVAGIVGLARALQRCAELREAETGRLAGLRERLREGIAARIPQVRINTPRHAVLPQILNVSFAGVDGEAVLLSLNAAGVAVATGSACTSESLEPSHVLRAMGVGDELAGGSIRFSLGRATDERAIDRTLDALAAAVDRLRQLSPLYEEVQ